MHFTHRHAHSGDGDTAAVHGSLSKLAEVELNRLKRDYASVFAEPVYPVDRSAEHAFEHTILLKDENAPPPKRRLYPLD